MWIKAVNLYLQMLQNLVDDKNTPMLNQVMSLPVHPDPMCCRSGFLCVRENRDIEQRVQVGSIGWRAKPRLLNLKLASPQSQGSTLAAQPW